MEIRDARPDEYQTVGDLTADVYLADGHLTFGEDDPYLPVLRDAASRAESADVLVAVEDGQILGAVTLSIGPGRWSDIATPEESEIRVLVVRHDARGRGIGETLVRACIERAKQRGAQRMVLSSAPTQLSGQAIYRKLGFVPVPERDWHPLPDAPDLVLHVFALDWTS